MIKETVKFIRESVLYYKVKKDWKDRKSGKKMFDYNMGAGYYLPGQLFGYNNDIGMLREVQLQSGKVGIYKLLKVETYTDPSDMIENSYWQLMGYKGEKLFAETSFEEYWNQRVGQKQAKKG